MTQMTSKQARDFRSQNRAREVVGTQALGGLEAAWDEHESEARQDVRRRSRRQLQPQLQQMKQLQWLNKQRDWMS